MTPEPLAAVAASVRLTTARVVDQHGEGTGTCVAWGDSWTFVTNAHVVRGRRARVQFSDGSWCEARVKERDVHCDLALLRLSRPAPLALCKVRRAATLRPGEVVFAIGNPLGLDGAVSVGIVHRRSARYVAADVRLLPGNSGGPLADAHGFVVGINSMVANGLALAIPSEVVGAFLRDACDRAA